MIHIHDMYQRLLSEQIAAQFHLGNVIILVGSRQVGKTTLIESLLKKTIAETDIAYPNHAYAGINRDNFTDIVLSL